MRQARLEIEMLQESGDNTAAITGQQDFTRRHVCGWGMPVEEPKNDTVLDTGMLVGLALARAVLQSELPRLRSETFMPRERAAYFAGQWDLAVQMIDKIEDEIALVRARTR